MTKLFLVFFGFLLLPVVAISWRLQEVSLPGQEKVQDAALACKHVNAEIAAVLYNFSCMDGEIIFLQMFAPLSF